MSALTYFRTDDSVYLASQPHFSGMSVIRQPNLREPTKTASETDAVVSCSRTQSGRYVGLRNLVFTLFKSKCKLLPTVLFAVATPGRTFAVLEGASCKSVNCSIGE